MLATRTRAPWPLAVQARSARDRRVGWSAPECSRTGFQLSTRPDGPRAGQVEGRGRGDGEDRKGRAREIASVDAEEAIERRIHVIRHERVMLDADLAALYGVETGRLNEAVRRNLARFPQDFMFQLAAEEARNLRSQNAISSSDGYGGRRYLPYAFTEQGVAMLSSVLNSRRAIAVNILIVRTFVQLRRAEGQYAELRQHIGELAHRVHGHDELLAEILTALEALAQPAATSSRPIGFRPPGCREPTASVGTP
jgi:ORF6N domain-containing protein